MTYRKGQVITCPACGEETVVTVRTEMDGWTRIGESFACKMCDATLGRVSGSPPAATANRNASLDRLAGFLDTIADEKTEVMDDDGERRFCRDCRHFLDHPFQTRCIHHNRDVSPMGDCADYQPRPQV